jgi:hypothetical protein
MNQYYENILDFRKEITSYIDCIFRTYGKELVLRLEEYNLLQNKHNCIESSTAFGFVLEEFIVAKLEMYTHCDDSTKYKIFRFDGPTSSESYDSYSINGDNCKFLVNIKAEKKGSSNDGIAAIAQLHKNYCLDNPEQEKSFVLFKILYSIREATEDSAIKRAKPRHIHIDGIESYCLEEVDFSKEHQQDNRSWSKVEPENAEKKKKNSGRLRISSKFRKAHKVNKSKISYRNTKNMLENLVKNNN